MERIINDEVLSLCEKLCECKFKSIKDIRLADWDTTVTNIFAKRAIQFLLGCGAEKLPKETMIVFER